MKLREKCKYSIASFILGGIIMYLHSKGLLVSSLTTLQKVFNEIIDFVIKLLQ